MSGIPGMILSLGRRVPSEESLEYLTTYFDKGDQFSIVLPGGETRTVEVTETYQSGAVTIQLEENMDWYRSMVEEHRRKRG
jgi:hypothetical protein